MRDRHSAAAEFRPHQRDACETKVPFVQRLSHVAKLGDAPTEVDRKPVADTEQTLEHGLGPRAPAADSIFLQKGYASAEEGAALIDLWMDSVPFDLWMDCVPFAASKSEFANEWQQHVGVLSRAEE